MRLTPKITRSSKPREDERREPNRSTHPLEFVKFDEHDCLLWAQMPSERLADVWDERDHDRQTLARKSCDEMMVNERNNRAGKGGEKNG